jgi:hypothetical protein
MRDDAIILSCAPKCSAAHELGEDGRVVVFQPRFEWRPLQRLMVRLNRPHVRVRLDEVGSFIWLRCNGSTRISDIALALEQQFGDKVPGASARTVLFFRSLARSGLIELQRAEPSG